MNPGKQPLITRQVRLQAEYLMAKIGYNYHGASSCVALSTVNSVELLTVHDPVQRYNTKTHW